MATLTYQTNQVNAEPKLSLSCTINDKQQWSCSAVITVPAAFVEYLYNQALQAQKYHVNAHGFVRQDAPLEYLAQNYHHAIIDHIKEFLFKYSVLNYLYEQIRQQKIHLVGEPRLIKVDLALQKDAEFYFDLSLYPPLSFQEWKYFPFKAPKRKNYKDLDRQVENFITEEQQSKERYVNNGIDIGDWVNFSLRLRMDSDKFENRPSHFWLRIVDEEVDRPFVDLFHRKKNGDTFTTESRCIQEYLSDPFSKSYGYDIEILDVIPHAYFCFDLFKHHFRLKTNKELYLKFIEVYSYRNDLSLRRSMVEEALRTLLHKHPFEVPNYLVLRQQKAVLDTVQENPDYYVYRMQKDFKERVRELAYKQVQEHIFLDQLAYDEGINPSPLDIKAYLNLTIRPRTREFMYSPLCPTKIRGQEVPVRTSELNRLCIRDKALNYLLIHLNKR